MTTLSCALALLSGAIGAGFASGREIAVFFAAHGRFAYPAALLACLTLALAFTALPRQLSRSGALSLSQLCRLRLGARLGRLCAGLFFLLFALTGGAMLAACAELFALTLPIHGAYALGLIASLAAGALLGAQALRGLSLPGGALILLLVPLLMQLYALPGGEACFAPAARALDAAAHGVAYGALNAALLSGMLPLTLPLSRRQRRLSALLFAAMLGAVTCLAIAVLQRHRQSALLAPLPFVSLSRALGKPGFYLCAGAMYAAALSTLCAMLAGLRGMLSGLGRCALPLGALCCLLAALIGFGPLVERVYPTLGALCAALLGLLCLPLQYASSSSR